jgi:hypothetical protein
LKAQSPRQGTVRLRGRGQYLNINRRMKNSFVFKEEKIRGEIKNEYQRRWIWLLPLHATAPCRPCKKIQPCGGTGPAPSHLLAVFSPAGAVTARIRRQLTATMAVDREGVGRPIHRVWLR